MEIIGWGYMRQRGSACARAETGMQRVAFGVCAIVFPASQRRSSRNGSSRGSTLFSGRPNKRDSSRARGGERTAHDDPGCAAGKAANAAARARQAAPPAHHYGSYSSFAPAEAIAFSLYSIGSLKRRMRKRNRICEAEYCCSAPLIVMKFLSDCKRSTQTRGRQGVIGHEDGAARAS